MPLGDTTRARWDALYRAHAPAARRLAFVLTRDESVADDLVQDAFVRVLGRFRGDRSPESFAAYLRTTVVNLARSRARRRGRERRALEIEGGRARADDTVADPAGRDDRVWTALSELRPRRRAAVFLRYYEGLSHAEIATALDCSPEAVKSLLRHGLAHLRRRLEEEET